MTHGIPYLIEDDVNGMLVEKDDWESAAEKVVELANDEDKRKEMVANGLRTVKERFDARRLAKECEELYLKINQQNVSHCYGRMKE